METINLLNHSDILAEGTPSNTAALIATIVVGLLVCFFGLKLMKILAAFMGLLIGAGLGAVICSAAGLEGAVSVAVVIGAAIVMAVLSFIIYRFGVFIVVWCAVVTACISLINPQGALLAIICVVIALVLAVMAAAFVEPVIIISTGIAGGISAGIAAASLIGLVSPAWIGYVIGIVLAIAGVGIQFMLHSRKISKKEQVHADKFKEQVSMESEVEKARKILEEDSDDE